MAETPSGAQPAVAGYILMEAVVACLILSFAIVALMPIYSLSARSDLRTEQTLIGGHLASELLEEIKLRKWDEAASPRGPGWPVLSPSALGPDPGEDRRDKRTFNDVDDFDGWSEQPPQDPMGRPLAGLDGYSRSVIVRYLDDDGAPSDQRTANKSVAVCVRHRDAARTCLERLFTNR